VDHDRTSPAWVPATLSAILALGLYAVSLGGTYIYDDAVVIGLDPRVKDPHLWGQFWTHDWWNNGAVDNLYRPLVSQSFGLQWWAMGDRAWAFHLANILLHAGASALVAELARRLAGWRVGLIAGLLFAAHPVHSEAVASIVGRAELACAVGLFAALILFLKPIVTTRRAIAIGAVSLVAMLSKEQGLLMPGLLAALLPVRQKFFPGPLTKKQREPILLVFCLVIWTFIGLFYLREYVLHMKFEWDRSFLDIAMQPLVLSHGIDRWLIPLAVLGRYFLLLVAPVKLSIDYNLAVIGPTISVSDPYLIVGAIVLAGWTIATVVCLTRRSWVALFCLVAMALTYSVASNIVILAAIFGERLMYLPSAFFLILVGIALAKLPRLSGNLVLVILLCLASLRTFTYVQRWNNRDDFYRYSLLQQPRSLKLHLLLSFADYEENKLPESRQIMDEAEAIYPGYWQLWKMTALIDEKENKWPQAVKDWKRAFDLYPAGSMQAQWAHAMEMAAKQCPTTKP
jgi:protein O-mannosyl-transferase